MCTKSNFMNSCNCYIFPWKYRYNIMKLIKYSFLTFICNIGNIRIVKSNKGQQ